MSPRKALKAQSGARARTQSQDLITAFIVAVNRLDGKAPAASQLRQLGRLREQLERTTRVTLQQAHFDGESWPTLGAALMMSPQGAQQKAAILNLS